MSKVCALLVVFWAATDQLEAFARTHGADEKLSEPSWREIGRWMEPLLLECDAMNVLFVAVMLHAVGKIPKLHTQLAPEVGVCLGGLLHRANCRGVWNAGSKSGGVFRNLGRSWGLKARIHTTEMLLPARLVWLRPIARVRSRSD